MRVKSVQRDMDINYSIYAAASKSIIYILRMDEDCSSITILQYFTLYEGDVRFFSISVNQELFSVCGDGEQNETTNFISCRPLTQPSQPTTSILRP